MSAFKSGDRVKCVQPDRGGNLIAGEIYTVGPYCKSGTSFSVFGIPFGMHFLESRFVLAEPAEQTYEQRREAIARQRNPQRPIVTGVDWGCVPSHTVYAVTGDGFYTIGYPDADWRPEPNTDGIARAVAAINAPYEPRLGVQQEV